MQHEMLLDANIRNKSATSALSILPNPLNVRTVVLQLRRPNCSSAIYVVPIARKLIFAVAQCARASVPVWLGAHTLGPGAHCQR